MPRRARENPFATTHVLKVRYRLRDESWAGLLDRLERMRFRAAIVGPEGRGKTTLLEDLQPMLEARGYKIIWLRLTRDEPLPSRSELNQLAATAGPDHILLIDGAEQLGWWTWRWLRRRTRHAGGLLVTSHRPGLLPTLISCSTDEDLLADIVATLLHTPADQLRSEASALFRKHRGNLREALREMYDVWAAGRSDSIESGHPRVTSSH